MKNSHGVGEHQVVRVEPVPALDDLVVPLGRQVALGRDHPALAGAGRRARHRGALGQRHLRLDRQRAEAHAGDVDRDVELDRLLREARAEHRLGHALLAVALDHEAGERARQEDQLVPVRDLLEHREAAHPVAAELGLHVDVVDDLRREDLAVAEDGALAGLRSRLPSEDQLALARLERVVVVELLAADELLQLRAACRGRRCGTCARSARCRRRSTRPRRSRCRATRPCRRRRSSPSYIESPRPGPTSPQMIWRPRCIMKPVIEPASPSTMIVPPFWSMPGARADLALDDQVAAAHRRAGQRAGVATRSPRRRTSCSRHADQPTRPLIWNSAPSMRPQPK